MRAVSVRRMDDDDDEGDSSSSRGVVVVLLLPPPPSGGPTRVQRKRDGRKRTRQDTVKRNAEKKKMRMDGVVRLKRESERECV